MAHVRIAVLGAGREDFVRRFAAGLSAGMDGPAARLALFDADGPAHRRVERRVTRDAAERGGALAVESASSQRSALEGARHIVVARAPTEAPGPRARERALFRRHGVDPRDGDPYGPAALWAAIRRAPFVFELCRDIHEVAHDDPLLLHAGGPHAVDVWLAHHYGGIPALGIAAGLDADAARIAAALERHLAPGRRAGAKGRRRIAAADLDVTALGIDRLSWFVRVLHDGLDWAERLPALLADRPPSPPATGAARDFPLLRDGGGSGADETAAVAAQAAAIVTALETGRTHRGHGSVVNGEAIDNLDGDAIVTTPFYADRHGISVPAGGPLPAGCAAMCAQALWRVRLAAEAAFEGDLHRLKQALWLDPSVLGASPAPAIGRLVDEWAVAFARRLPSFAPGLRGARKRLAATRTPAVLPATAKGRPPMP